MPTAYSTTDYVVVNCPRNTSSNTTQMTWNVIQTNNYSTTQCQIFTTTQKIVNQLIVLGY